MLIRYFIFWDRETIRREKIVDQNRGAKGTSSWPFSVQFSLDNV